MPTFDYTNLPTWYIEQAANQTYPGLQTFVRDTNLTVEEAARYHVGSVIRADDYVVATPRVGGMATTHRFAILSNRMYDATDLADTVQGASCAPRTTRRAPRFKVLGILRAGGLTQIVLLHLLDDERWQIWQNTEFSVDSDIMESVRANFHEKAAAKPIPELKLHAWMKACEGAIGFAATGAPLPIGEDTKARLASTSSLDFRSISGHLIYIEDGKKALRLNESEWDEVYPGLIAYGYVDHVRGLCCAILASARLDTANQLEVRRDLDDMSIRIEAGALGDLRCAGVIDDVLGERAELVETMCFQKEEPESVEALRSIRALDPFRHRDYPDDVRALLVGDGIETPEAVWLRLEILTEGNDILARLLNEPAQRCGVHTGDLLPLAFYDTDDDTLLVAVTHGNR
ncbi:hypothetical protein B5F74_02275 [Collinsella sp. An271]|uniref:hypothetical protein n=1 Tax=Collinsella sp. An271 TaxID=1965616 RepID=UPI000B379982|nr:hypothetical protein [Collinsella sp. An271]OUO62058.1 hypothetical protein B5F74_02275 [Collinsella sp. An271]